MKLVNKEERNYGIKLVHMVGLWGVRRSREYDNNLIKGCLNDQSSNLQSYEKMIYSERS
jgi:hypothetical protein